MDKSEKTRKTRRTLDYKAIAIHTNLAGERFEKPEDIVIPAHIGKKVLAIMNGEV